MRFLLPDDAPLRSYIVTAALNRPSFQGHVPADIQWYDALNERDSAYCIALSRANSFAHDGRATPGTDGEALGMPRWVQLDCCLLPAAMVGFEARREDIPQDIANELDPSGSLSWIAVSEYVALPSVEAGRHTGISMFSLVRQRSLGVRSKALGLRAVRSRQLIGVTQYSSPGVAVHLRFGPLEIVSPSVAVHSRPHETFVYRLAVPPAAALDELVEGSRKDMPIDFESDWRTEYRFDPRDPAARQDAKAYIESRPTWIVGCGPVEDGNVTELVLGRPRASKTNIAKP